MIYLCRSLRPLVVALFPGQSRSLDKVRAMRVRLSNELAETINEFGPKVFEDFNEVCHNNDVHHCGTSDLRVQFRILVPSASVPPSSGNSGLWRRKSSTGAVDAQGNLLVHPMVRHNVFLIYASLIAFRPGWTNDFSDGVRAPLEGQVRGLVQVATRLVVQQPQTFQTTKTALETTTTFSVYLISRIRRTTALEVHAARTLISRSCVAHPMHPFLRIFQ